MILLTLTVELMKLLTFNTFESIKVFTFSADK